VRVAGSNPFGFPIGSTIHVAQVLEKTSGGYTAYLFYGGQSQVEPYFIDDAAALVIFSTLGTAIAVPVSEDALQIIKGAIWTSDFNPPPSPIKDDTTSLTEIFLTDTLTLSVNPSNGDTLTIHGGYGGDITFTFVHQRPTNILQIQIGDDINATAANIAKAINAIPGADYTATALANVITLKVYTPTFLAETTCSGLSLGSISKTFPSVITPAISATVSFDCGSETPGEMIVGKRITQNISVADNMDSLIDSILEQASVNTFFDTPMVKMDEEATAHTVFDALTDYIGNNVLVIFA
jgi:hypothetical protein